MLNKDVYHVGDIVMVRFNDEDEIISGTVDRDSEGRLFLRFADNSIAYNDFEIQGG